MSDEEAEEGLVQVSVAVQDTPFATGLEKVPLALILKIQPGTPPLLTDQAVQFVEL